MIFWEKRPSNMYTEQIISDGKYYLNSFFMKQRVMQKLQ